MRRASLCLSALLGIVSACSSSADSNEGGKYFGQSQNPAAGDGTVADDGVPDDGASPSDGSDAPSDGSAVDGGDDGAEPSDGSGEPDASRPPPDDDLDAGSDDETSGEDAASDDGDARDDGGAVSSDDGDAEADASTPPVDDPTIDPNDPPVATDACGTDLDVRNGRVIPALGSVPNGGEFSANPLDPGPLSVLAQDATRPNPDASRQQLSVTTYGPSSDGATIDAGPFPLLVLLPGFSSQHTGYRHFTDHFVSHGVAVLGITPANWGFLDAANNPANVAEVRAVLDWALTESPLAGKIDDTKIAIAGHSEGGKIAFFTAAVDPRFDLVIGWDPQNGGGPPCAIAPFVGADCNNSPVAPNCEASDSGKLAGLRAESIVFAARDANVTPDPHLWAENFYRGAPSPAHMLLFPNAGHADWSGAGATTEVTKRVQMALVLSRFFGKSRLDDDLPQGSYVAGLTNVEAFSK